MTRDCLSDDVTLFHGDALGILAELPDASVDAVLTDPPYSSGGVTFKARQAAQSQKYQKSSTKRRYPHMLGDAKDQRSWTMWCSLWLGECWRVAREGAPLLVFTDWRQLPAMSDALQAAGWVWRGIVVWDKQNVIPQIGRFRHQCEYVLYATRGPIIAHTKTCLPGMFSHRVSSSQKVSLASKPVQLIEDLLAVTPPQARVLDPFMGGGSEGGSLYQDGARLCGNGTVARVLRYQPPQAGGCDCGEGTGVKKGRGACLV